MIVPFVGKTMVAKQDKLQDKALKDIEKIKSTKMQQTMRKNMEENQKKEKFEQQKSAALKLVEERKLEHGVVSRRNAAPKGSAAKGATGAGEEGS